MKRHDFQLEFLGLHLVASLDTNDGDIVTLVFKAHAGHQCEGTGIKRTRGVEKIKGNLEEKVLFFTLITYMSSSCFDIIYYHSLYHMIL